MAAILMAPRIVAQQTAFLTNGLVAYYPFNGSTKEFSRNGEDAVLKGSNPSFYTNNPAGLVLRARLKNHDF